MHKLANIIICSRRCKNIFVDIGDDQSIESDLSTYSAHLSKMKYFIDFANSKTLILIDEFGTGTDPQFGGPIAEAVLENLRKVKTGGRLPFCRMCAGVWWNELHPHLPIRSGACQGRVSPPRQCAQVGGWAQARGCCAPHGER